MAESVGISLLLALSKLPSGKAIEDLYGQISSAQHDNLQRRPVSDGSLPRALKGADVANFNFDEGHIGRFTVFETNHATVALDDVMRHDDPLRFIRDHLAVGDDASSGETVVFSPGLNTPHEAEKGLDSIPAPERVVHYSKTLGGLRMAQLHTGSSIDQGPAELDVSNSLVLNALFRAMDVAGVEAAEPNDKGEVEVPANMIDFLQVAMSHFDIEDNRLKQSMRALLELATPEDPIVLMPYSRATIELTSALRTHKNNLMRRMSKERAERHLRDTVVVVSVGNASHEWVDGPAYIHVAAYEDSLTDGLGTKADKPVGAGADAVFLTCKQPWNNSGNEAHNFATSACQFLSVIMLANNTNSFRRLYELARGSSGRRDGGSGASRSGRGDDEEDDGNALGRVGAVVGSFLGRVVNREEGAVGGGKLAIPENVDELTNAMIRITNGFNYLWSDDAKDGAQDIPEKREALELLKDHFDAEKVDRISASCR